MHLFIYRNAYYSLAKTDLSVWNYSFARAPPKISLLFGIYVLISITIFFMLYIPGSANSNHSSPK
jgi:hypothetical protein